MSEGIKRKHIIWWLAAMVVLVVFFAWCTACDVQAAERSPWFVQVNPLVGEDIDFGLQFGGGYTFAKQGISLGLVYGALRFDSQSGEAKGSVDFDDYFRWPPVPVTVPYREASRTLDTIAVTFTWHPPLGK